MYGFGLLFSISTNFGTDLLYANCSSSRRGQSIYSLLNVRHSLWSIFKLPLMSWVSALRTASSIQGMDLSIDVCIAQ